MSEKRLGRGLESLLGSSTTIDSPAAPAEHSRELPVDIIRPNPLQPRHAFEEREMAELVDSIRQVGILQPLMVRRVGERYELVAGERRLRAAKIVGLARVPVVERKVSDDEMLTLALVENLQREDLNPVEKAKGFKHLIDRFELTQEEAAKRLGKDRSTVANFMRLLDLPESVQHVVSRGTISMGHARALLGLPHASTQQAVALRIEEEGLSVREVEKLVAGLRATPQKSKRREIVVKKSAHIRDIENRAREKFGTKVTIESIGQKGRLVVHFYSDDDFQRILEVLSLSE